MKKEFTFLSSNNKTNIRAVEYIPEQEIVAVLQIAHGMVEFIDRYEDFANYLNSKGILVVGNDHLGHGGSVNSEDEWGYFGDNGNQILLDDMHKLYEITGGVLAGVITLVPVYPFIIYLAIALLIIGVFVGFIGSYISVCKYLRLTR